jgi:hypothetical protein
MKHLSKRLGYCCLNILYISLELLCAFFVISTFNLCVLLPMEVLVVDGRIIFKWILRSWDGRVRTGSLHFHGSTEENSEKSQSVWLISRPRFEPRTSGCEEGTPVTPPQCLAELCK